MKICVIVVGLWIIYTMGQRFYWYYKSDGGNVWITLSSQYNTISSDIDIYINDELIFKDEKYLSFYEFLKFNLPFGLYDLRVIVDGKEYTRRFFLFPVKFLYIEVSKDQISNDSIREPQVIIDISSSPINMM